MAFNNFNNQGQMFPPQNQGRQWTSVLCVRFTGVINNTLENSERNISESLGKA